MTKTVKGKRFVACVAIILSLFTIVFGTYAIVFDNPNHQWSKEASRLMDSAAIEITTNGISPGLGDYLSQEGAQTEAWLATAVLEPLGLDDVLFTGRVVAASDPRLVGLFADEAATYMDSRRPEDQNLCVFGKEVTVADGTTYHIYAYGASRYFIGFSWLVGTMMFYSAIAAWLALGVWVALDVNEFQKDNVIPWTVLTLVTGPVALGVWLIFRSGKHKAGPANCPSCGSDIPKGAAYCVRCGHQTIPLCPRCKKRVELDWEYCGSCGALLSDES